MRIFKKKEGFEVDVDLILAGEVTRLDVLNNPFGFLEIKVWPP